MLYDPNNPESFLVLKDGEVLDYDKYLKQESLISNTSSVDQNYVSQDTSESEDSPMDRQNTLESNISSVDMNNERQYTSESDVSPMDRQDTLESTFDSDASLEIENEEK